MKTYELLCVLPGTLAESEVEPVSTAIQTSIAERGGTVELFTDLGKTRLSYPMKHIRYGYFRLCRFSAEPKDVVEIDRRLRMMKDVLRVFLTTLNPKNAGMNTIQFMPTLHSERGEAAAGSPEAALASVSLPEDMKPQPVSSVHTEKGEDKRVKLEDIDKKLDEILENDIASQL